MRQNYILPFLYIVIAVLGFPLLGHAKDFEKVALFPFSVETAGKYSSLENGLRAMIAGRLDAENDISVVENTIGRQERLQFVEDYPEKADSLFRELDAEHIGAGRMTAAGDSLTLEITLYRKDGGAPVLLKTEAENEQQILDAVENLSRNIVDEVLGIEPVTVAAAPTENRRGTEAFQTEHPDRRLKEDIVSGAAVSMDAANVAISRGEIVRRSSSLADGIISLASGDLDGNGTREIVVASTSSLKLFHYDRGMLEVRGVYAFEQSHIVHAVNIADLDEDGRGEIYLSGVKNDLFSSMILSWNAGSGFQVIMEDIRWAIRPLELAEEGYVLAGQRKAQAQKYFLQPGIYMLETDSAGTLRRGKKLSTPGGINLFDFIQADIDGDGTPETVAVTSRLRLAVFNQHNRLLWGSEDEFGGSKTYLGSWWQEENSKVIGEVANDEDSSADLQYVPVRLLAADINNDGREEIISAKNTLSTFKMLKNLRGFSNGNVVCLSWNGQEMKELWSTDSLDGYVAAVEYIGDPGEEGQAVHDRDLQGKAKKVRLLVGQVPNKGFANFLNFTNSKGKLVVYDFEIVDKPAISKENSDGV